MLSNAGMAVLIAWGVTAVLMALLIIAAIGGPVADGNGNDIRTRKPRPAPRPGFPGRAAGIADQRLSMAELARARETRMRYLRSVMQRSEREPRTRARSRKRKRTPHIDVIA